MVQSLLLRPNLKKKKKSYDLDVLASPTNRAVKTDPGESHVRLSLVNSWSDIFRVLK